MQVTLANEWDRQHSIPACAADGTLRIRAPAAAALRISAGQRMSNRVPHHAWVSAWLGASQYCRELLGHSLWIEANFGKVSRPQSSITLKSQRRGR